MKYDGKSDVVQFYSSIFNWDENDMHQFFREDRIKIVDNAKARKVYESWGGRLSDWEHDFVVMNEGYPEVFYTYEI